MAIQLRRLLRDTAQRSPLTRDWDFEAIFNRELYPAIRQLFDVVAAILRTQVFDLTGASHTLLLEHVHGYVRISHPSACTLTVPTDATGGFVPGDWVRGIQAGAGVLTVVAAAGVTINKPETLVLYKQWATWTLINVATDTWDFDGDVELA